MSYTADQIFRDKLALSAPSIPEYREYPMMLYHPTHPPVVVNIPGERAGMLAQGYRQIGQDAEAAKAAFARARAKSNPDRVIVGYPKYVHGKIAANAEEEARIRAAAGETPAQSDQAPRRGRKAGRGASNGKAAS